MSKNRPRPTPETQPYWDACQRHELQLQRCRSCQQFQFYPRVVCTKCGHDQLDWTRASGAGKIVSFTVVRRAISAAYAAEVPYVIALIELDEGPQMMSNVVECDIDAVAIGMDVAVCFDDWDVDITIPKFKPAR